MSAPFPRVKGVAIVAPSALLDAARWVTCFNYDDPGQFDSFSIELGPEADGSPTHWACNYQRTSNGFWWLVRAGSLMANRPWPEWMDDDAYALAIEADDNAVVWDVHGLCDDAPETMPLVADFAEDKVVLIPLRTGRWSEARDALSAELVRIEDE